MVGRSFERVVGTGKLRWRGEEIDLLVKAKRCTISTFCHSSLQRENIAKNTYTQVFDDWTEYTEVFEGVTVSQVVLVVRKRRGLSAASNSLL